VCLIRLPQLGQAGSLGVFIRRLATAGGAQPLETAPPFCENGAVGGAHGVQANAHPIPHCQYSHRIFRRCILTRYFLPMCLRYKLVDGLTCIDTFRRYTGTNEGHRRRHRPCTRPFDAGALALLSGWRRSLFYWLQLCFAQIRDA
jgi:hypothetical protein